MGRRATTRSRDEVRLPSAAVLKRLKLSREVAWYLVSRGIPLPDCPPLIKTPEPGETCPGAKFDPERVDKVLASFALLRHTKGKWAAAELPNWDASKPSNGNWGGSSTAVTAQSKHPKQAMEFITWLNTDPEAVKALVSTANIYPADIDASKDALTAPPAFFADQKDFFDIAAKASADVAPFTYGPNVNVAYSAYTDAFAKAAESKDPAQFEAALETMQSTTKADLKKSGFTVK